MDNPISGTYNEWKETETALFQAYPLLKVGKAVTQGLALPALTAGAATHLPLAGPLIAGAVHRSTDFIQNNLHGLNEARIGDHFAELRNNIPEGWGQGVKLKAFDGWAKLRTADLMAKSDMLTRPLAGYIAPSVIGKAILDTAPKIGGYVSQLPGAGLVGQVLAQGQAVLQRTQDFLTMTRQHVRAVGLDTEKFIELGLNKMANKQEQGQPVDNDRVTPDPGEIKTPETILNDSPTKLEVEPETILNDSPTSIEPPIAEVDQPSAESPFVPIPVNSVAEAVEQAINPVDKVPVDYFQKLASELGGKNLNTEKMKIFMDGKEVFRLSDGQPDPRHTDVTQDQMKAFQDALADPGNFKGTLEIRQGPKILLSIRDGQVYDPMGKIQDLLSVKMTNEPENIPQTTAEGFYQRHSEGVTAPGIQGTAQVAKNALKVGHTQSEILTMLTEHDPMIKRTIEQKGPDAGLKEAKMAVDGASRELLMGKSPKQEQGQAQRQEQKQEQTQVPGL